ncbi:MAG: M23 family metallopeptidase [Terriglobales bacterium]
MRKRFYVLFVARDAEGELRKIHVPLHYLYVFLAGAVLGMLMITGIAGSYTRMALKVARFNQLQSEKEQLKTRYQHLEKVDKEKDIQVASLGSLASEVSALYGLKSGATPLAAGDNLDHQQVLSSFDQLDALRNTALNGAATVGIRQESAISSSLSLSTADWVRLADAPSLWPVDGQITAPFGQRIDPFNGEGAFHRGVDISCSYGHRVVAPADGKVSYADFYSGYGRMIVLEHGYGISTRYGHLSSFSVADGETVKRGDVIGYVGMSGKSTGPHLHYEVWVHNTPVNPYKFLRTTSASARLSHASTGGE